MKFRRPIAAVGMLGLGLLVAAGCQPNPPAPTVRGYKFEIVRGGPFVVGQAENGDPIALTDTPPEVFVAAEDEDCDPIAEAADVQLVRGTYVENGTTYDAWYLNGGVIQAIVPAEAKCLPRQDGSNYVVGGVAETLNDDGPFDGLAPGLAVDERIGQSSPFALYKLVK
ncbi:hypothetical protein [Dermatobacter hominis]|uniref:hypothetical protein n=1 Tax=Dermatobacter hominis TaxID=2884263 RepID=UPI001D109354|nr:hypothetical protein [Dermatobacter hominis]UDY35890.1 hypothetical protein LH044_21550 [Dermatobacter hominis]